MLSRLSIRDIVLIDRLDIEFAGGLAVLTGETGAGKSILLDSFALALGGRGDQGLVRQGAEQGQVTAVFELARNHPANALLSEHGIPAEDELILRRVQFGDGRTRAYINDEPVSVQVLKALGQSLVEIHGQHDDRALVDAATHRRLLDAFGGLEADAARVETLWHARREASEAAEAHRAEVERAKREGDWLRHAVEELNKLAPEEGEETALADRRTMMMQSEKIAGDLREAHDAVGGSSSAVPALAAAIRRLERRSGQAPTLIEPAVKSLDAALNALHAQVRLELRHAARQEPIGATAIELQAVGIVRDFARSLPEVRRLLDTDVAAAFRNDPAARSVDEVLLCYPGVIALIHHRLAHRLHELGTPLVARVIAELAHSETGIDIHPGARIGAGFFIDHGTGVVIGETAIIGANVRIYQAVTLGAKRFESDAEGNLHKGRARHPIVEDDVVIYAGATVLGRITIGAGSTIGGNVWLTRSVSPGSNVTQANSQHEVLNHGAGI